MTNPVIAQWFRGVGMPPGGTTGQMPAKASNADFDYEWVDPGSGGPVSWASITNKPTSLAGYGITDAATAAQGVLAATAVQPGQLSAVATTGAYSDLSGRPTSWAWGVITGTPTTLAGYGISDAATAAQGALAATAVQPAALTAGLATKADAAATSAAIAAVNGRLVGFDRIEAVTEYPVPEEAGVLYVLVGAP